MSVLKGPTGFEAYYRELYGDRWKPLEYALRADPRYVTIAHDGCEAYYLDEASHAAAAAVGAEPGMDILDACAAPGGKTLVLAGALDGLGALVSNERSKNRRERLKRVLEAHLPARLASVVTVTGHDARRWNLHETDAFDAVLLDVPCSAERHLIDRPAELAKWSRSRTKRLAQQGYAMLASALDAVRSGGVIVYCTCTISPAENDAVIERLCRKRPGRVEVLPVEMPWGDATGFGRLVLPDTGDGRGPMFVSRVRRLR